MATGSCHAGTFSGALQRVGISRAISHGLLAATGLFVICAGSARSADAGAPPPGLRMPDPLLSLRDMYPELTGLRDAHEYTREFRPRAKVDQLPDPDGAATFRSANLPQTSAWQRMSEFRSSTGVRLLTLWRATAGTVALHEGKHGGMTVQWTSQALSSGSASRGLLDHLVSTVRDARAPLRAPAASVTAAREP
jgi:hypothetical protein